MKGPPSCVRCSQSHSNPHAFLLTCASCAKSWHHRCHLPPLPDPELVARIKAFTEGDVENGIHGWRCRRCAKNSIAANKQIVPSPHAPSPTAFPQPPPVRQSGPSTEQLRESKTPAAPSAILKRVAEPSLPGGQERVLSHPRHDTTPPAGQVLDITSDSDDERAKEAVIVLEDDPPEEQILDAMSVDPVSDRPTTAPPQPPRVKYDLAPMWVLQRHLDLQASGTPQGALRRAGSGAGRKTGVGTRLGAARESFYFSAAVWCKEKLGAPVA